MLISSPAPAADLPPLEGDSSWSYDNLLATMTDGKVWAHEDNAYQGDTFAIIQRGGAYGFVVFGWGSCSGCDALEAAHSDIAMATQLRDELYDSARWFSSLENFLHWQKSERGTGNLWYANNAAFHSLVREIRFVLEEALDAGQ